MSDRPVFIDPVSHFGDEVGDGRVPRWFSFVAVLVVAAAGFYGFKYAEGPSLDSPHTFREGVGVEVPAEAPAGAEH